MKKNNEFVLFRWLSAFELVLVAVLCVFFAIELSAQKSKSPTPSSDSARVSDIILIAKSYGDSIVLRWAPDKPGAWYMANDVGYIVERQDISDSTNLNPPYQKLTAKELKPWTKQEFLTKIKEPKENIYVAIAGQCLYGKVAVPKMDANNPINSLRMAADELSNKHGFSLFAADNNALAAEALALRFTDHAVKKGGKYVYKVSIAKELEDYEVNSAFVVVDCEPRAIDPPPLGLVAEENDKRIRLRWNNYPEGAAYSGFHVYRKDLKTDVVQQMNTTPITPMVDNSKTQTMPGGFEDSTLSDNYVPYEYSVRGVTTFAELSEPAVIVAMGRDRTPPPLPELKTPRILGKNMVLLEWTMSDVPGDLKGYVVAKSSNPTGTFRILTEPPIPGNQMSFIDTTANIGERYYIVGAIDTSGNIGPTLPIAVDLIDSLPPSMPNGFKGSMDSNGVVTLNWNLGPEEDLLGYRILWANDSTHEFSQREGMVIEDTTYNDSTNLNTGTPYIYYKLVAVDTRFMHSISSPILAVRRFDKIAPETPLISHVFVTDSSVSLRYIQARSEDLNYSVLQRRDDKDTVWKEIARLGKTDGEYIDKKVEKRMRYHYRMFAVDSIGNKSEPSPPVLGHPYDAGQLSPARNVKAVYDSTTKSIKVTWEKPIRENGADAWYVIYRAYEGHDIRQYRSVNNKTFRFEDKNLHEAGRYRYAVCVFSTIGQSPLTAEIEVGIK